MNWCGRLLVALLGLLWALPVCAADWPQFLGPKRNNVSAETGLLKKWPTGGPKLLWTNRDAGAGYSGPAIVGDRLYTMGARGNTEYVFALDIKSNGKQVWAAAIGPKFGGQWDYWNQGPSATPSVDDSRVYALGGQGILVCVDAADGKEIWRKDLPQDLAAVVSMIGGAAAKNGWGFTWSPLVDGDRLILQVGSPRGNLAALDKRTGKVLWFSKGLTEEASYASPIGATIAGQRQYIQLTYTGLTSVAADTGRVLWHYAQDFPDVLIPTPLVEVKGAKSSGLVYATGGGKGSLLLRLTSSGGKFKASKVYYNTNLKNRNGGVLLVNQHVFGYTEGRRAWVCQDFLSGKLTGVERRKLPRGSITYADDRLYCYGETDGTMVLVDADPKKWTTRGWTEHGRFTIPEHSKLRLQRGAIWTLPVVANGHLYLRDQNLMFCYDVRGR